MASNSSMTFDCNFGSFRIRLKSASGGLSFNSFLFSSLSNRILGRSFGSNLASLRKCRHTPIWSVLAAGAYRPCRSTLLRYFLGIAIWSMKCALPFGCLHVQNFPWAHINAEHSLCFAINDVKLAPFLFTGLSIPYGPMGLVFLIHRSLPSSSSSLQIPTDPLISAPIIGMRPSCLHPSSTFFSSSVKTASYSSSGYDDVGIYSDMTRYFIILLLESSQSKSIAMNLAVPDISLAR